ncbi:methyltransferase domain-containing protein [Embleya sp. MST-111070]|uniref:methyltransferase domain-containing protein n=1 Tax=Embleya sp. MST-111070 TaxID=3398231 RepID=UPI003F731FE3
MTDPADLGEYRRASTAAMDAHRAWPADTPWLREAFEHLPRDAFAPDRLWDWDGHAYVPVDRAADPDRWARLVYAGPYDAAITEVTHGRPTSSLSCTSVVADMLDSLDLAPGHRVLELGTGTGWNAALIAHHVGPTGTVTSVEVDPTLANLARTTLTRAGIDVDIRVGDGAKGCPDNVPYQRIIATYAVDRVPNAWIEQLEPGGDLVFPWGRLGHFALTLDPTGTTATGWCQGLAQFMSARDTTPTPTFDDIHTHHPTIDHEHEITRDLAPLRTNNVMWALRVALPDVRYTITAPGSDGTTVRVHDGAASWATLTTTRGDDRVLVREGGPRRFVGELLAAWDRWTDDGRIRLYDYGMTVTPTEQYVWAGDPDTGRRWPIRDPAPIGS